MKKRRTDDVRINGYQGYMANHMATGHGAAGFPGKHYSTRELSMLELRNMLMDKSRLEIRKKLQEWKSIAEAKINKDKENKRQKSTFNGKATDSEKLREPTVNGNRHPDIDSFPVRSDDTVEKNQTYVTINVPDPDFHNFDLDRDENSFAEDQVWAAYDDDDGMPRYYAKVHKVISIKPFKMRISWLNSRSNSELGPIDWVGKGEVWALYRNWSPDWNEHTPDDVIHKYDMVEVLEDFNEEEGILVTSLVKVAGFRTVFQRHMDHNQERRIPKEEMFRFSHQVPNYLLTGQEADNAPEGCRELDPAATPLDLLQIITEANKTSDNA
uniref:DUF3444 domain-containing protein n=1 Tax=Cajanus cajan TaxID=3821 RepID=A0A151TS46_CAJCA|nr:hypothetical protein KK1_009075 [Cajanus cajan]